MMHSVFVMFIRRLLCVATVGLLVLGSEFAALAADDVDAPATVEKKAAASPAGATSTLSFDRDSVQLVANPVEIWGLAFSADDRFLAASGGGGWYNTEPGEVIVWDVGKTKKVASYPTPRGDLTVTLSPEGRRVAWSSWSGEICLREIGGAELLRETFEKSSRLALSPDGQLLVAASERNQLRAWDALTGKPAEKFRGNTFPFFWVGFSPDGKFMAATGGKKNDQAGFKLAVWDVATRRQLYKQPDDLERIYSGSISPDSRTLATSGGKSISLWDLATGVRRTQTEETTSPTSRVEFSPDGSLLASVSYQPNNIVTLWDPATGKSVGTLTGHEREVRALTFTHDGKTLATGSSDQSIRLWDVASREQSGMLQGPRNLTEGDAAKAAITAVAYSSDGNNVATASDNGEVSIYSLAPAGLLRSWSAHNDAAVALAFSPDGQTLVSGGYDKAITLWNVATGDPIRSLTGHTGWVVSLAFSHDGQTLASGSYDRSIRLWNVADGAEHHILTGHTATVRSVAFSHNDKLVASAGADHVVRLWDTASGQEQAALAGHEAGVRSVAFSPDDRLLASGGEDQTIKIWNVASHQLAGTLTGHSDMVSTVAFAQTTLVSAGWDQTIRTWDAQALESRGKITTNAGAIIALAVAPDGNRLFSASADQSLILWKSTVVEGRKAEALGEYRVFPWTTSFSPDGKSLAVAAGGFELDGDTTDLYLYEVATRAEKYHVAIPGNVRSIDFAPAGDTLALGFATRQVLLVDAATGGKPVTLEERPADAPQPPRERLTDVAFSADGKLLAAVSNDRAVRIYDVEGRTLAKTLNGHKDRALAIAFSPNQEELISGSRDRTAIVWDLLRGEQRYAIPPQPGAIISVAWSPDGKLLATGCNKESCSLWHAETGTRLRTVAAHQGQVFQVRFSPDSKVLATGGEDRLVKLWDVASGGLLQTYDCQSGKVLCVRFSPDGKSFATTGRDGEARLWSVLLPESN